MYVRSLTASRARGTAVGITMVVVVFIGADGRTSARAQGGRAVNQRAPQPPGTSGNANLRGRHGPDPVKDPTAAERVEIAGRIYGAILDGAARRYREAPRAGGGTADARLVFDPRLAERLAAWSIRWARARSRLDQGRVSQFNAVRSHVERMSALEDGRSLREALERAGPLAVGLAAPAPTREFADVARFFRLEALWELEQIRAR